MRVREARLALAAAGALALVAGWAAGTPERGARWSTYRGAWFAVQYPPGFKVRPSLRSATATSGYDSAFFRSPDRSVEFYVYSPQWNGEPSDILVRPKTEAVVDRQETVRKGVHTREVSIRAKDGSYERAYVDVEDTGTNTRHTFGIRYRGRQAYARYRDRYLRFKASLEQFAD